MNTLLHDLRSAIRSLLRTPALAGFVVVTGDLAKEGTELPGLTVERNRVS